MNKREVVEQYLSERCMDLDILDTVNDPYPPDEQEQQAILDSVEGLISYEKYFPGTPEWENFEPEGWLWSTPTDEQVERLYPVADEYFRKLSAE